jgi:hypothetical protein
VRPFNSIEIRQNATLRRILATKTSSADENTFGLHHFTYNNPDFLEVVFSNLHNLQFEGIVVSVPCNCEWSTD